MKMTYTLWLIIINIVLFVFQSIATASNIDIIQNPGCTPKNEDWDTGCDAVSDIFSLNMKTLIERGWVWQIFTYMFVHAGVAHIFYNMFGLLIFGPKIEATMGKNKYIKYYLLCGLGSSIFYFLITTAATGISNTPMLGASGAIFGVLTAYGIMYPRDIIYVYFAIPMPAFLFVIIYGFIQIIGGVLNMFANTGGIAYFGHLGGMITGIILLKFFGYEKRKIRYFWE
jgi:membrane associated rhomboid family serine protease